MRKSAEPRVTTVESGCELHPDCFICPETDCMLSSRSVVKRIITKRKALDLWHMGVPASEISKRMGVSKRTIYRWLKDDNR